MTPGEPSSDTSERQAHAEATYERLFGPRDRDAPGDDPELMEILRRFIFGDVFDTGVLDDRTRGVPVRGDWLPLPTQGTVTDAERYDRGLAEQAPLYGNEIKDNLADLPAPFDEALPRFLTEFCFGDFYTRGGLALADRELLVLCALTTIGDTSAQLGPHGRACLQVGNSKAAVVAALVHCFPYVGFPRAVAAVRAVKDL
jgi:alkylhydroperoxidase/carboxymuconolactone decarboxylase family protein YurZ